MTKYTKTKRGKWRPIFNLNDEFDFYQEKIDKKFNQSIEKAIKQYKKNQIEGIKK